MCFNHLEQIRRALGINGVENIAYSWRSRSNEPGAQIDLLIDRKDQVVNICEMKYTDKEYAIDAAGEKTLKNKMAVFREETGSRKTLHLTMIAANGLKRNAYSGIVRNLVTMEDLFVDREEVR